MHGGCFGQALTTISTSNVLLQNDYSRFTITFFSIYFSIQFCYLQNLSSHNQALAKGVFFCKSWAWWTTTLNVLNKVGFLFNIVCKTSFLLLSKDISNPHHKFCLQIRIESKESWRKHEKWLFLLLYDELAYPTLLGPPSFGKCTDLQHFHGWVIAFQIFYKLHQHSCHWTFENDDPMPHISLCNCLEALICNAFEMDSKKAPSTNL